MNYKNLVNKIAHERLLNLFIATEEITQHPLTQDLTPKQRTKFVAAFKQWLEHLELVPTLLEHPNDVRFVTHLIDRGKPQF